MRTPLQLWAQAKRIQQAVRPETPPQAAPVLPPSRPEPLPLPSDRRDVDTSTDVRAVPDAWGRRFRPTAKQKPPEEEEVIPRNPGRPRVDPQKRRRNTISIALSEEEENLMRKEATKAQVSLSEWVRTAVFAHMESCKSPKPADQKPRAGDKLRARR